MSAFDPKRNGSVRYLFNKVVCQLCWLIWSAD